MNILERHFVFFHLSFSFFHFLSFCFIFIFFHFLSFSFIFSLSLPLTLTLLHSPSYTHPLTLTLSLLLSVVSGTQCGTQALTQPPLHVSQPSVRFQVDAPQKVVFNFRSSLVRPSLLEYHNSVTDVGTFFFSDLFSGRRGLPRRARGVRRLWYVWVSPCRHCNWCGRADRSNPSVYSTNPH